MALRCVERIVSTHKTFQGLAVLTRNHKMLALAKRQERKAFVRVLEDKNRLSISFNYGNEYVADRLFTLERRQDEHIEVSLSRLQMNITTIALKKFLKKQNAAKKKRSSTESSNKSGDGEDKKEDKSGEGPSGELDLNVVIQNPDGMVLDPSMRNSEAFRTGNTLIIDGMKYPIVVNAPTVIRISLPKIILSGFPIQAYPTLEYANISDCVFSWWRSSTKDDSLKDYTEDELIKDKSCTWIQIRGEHTKVFVPREEHVGRLIMVCCQPRDGAVVGVEASAISTSVVTRPLEKFPFEDRHLLTSEILPADQLRVVSYNLLAHVYSSTDYSKKVLFKYCPAEALDFEYRKHLLIKELLGYNADVLCLQEVDRGMFKHEMKDCFSLNDLEGIYGEKEAQSAEGCAVFFRRSKFSLVESYNDHIWEALKKEDCLTNLRVIIEQNPKLMKRLADRGTILQRVILRHVDTGREILVCNTHLYFHPDADHIRLLQAFISVRLAEEQLQKAKKQNDKECPILFCGDFNSSPEFGVYQLLTTGQVPHTSEDWKSNEQEAVNALTATIERTFSSACGTPDYTNYTVEFKGCLDYIFHTKELSVTSVVPLPPHEVVAHPKYLAIPSPCFPSDHLALVAAFRFNDKT